MLAVTVKALNLAGICLATKCKSRVPSLVGDGWLRDFWTVVKSSGSFKESLLDLGLVLEAWIPSGVVHLSSFQIPHQKPTRGGNGQFGCNSTSLSVIAGTHIPSQEQSKQRHSCLLSAHFLYSYTVLGPLAREWCCSQWGWARPHQLTFKTTTIVMPTGQSALENPSVGFSLVSNCPWAGPWDSVLLTLFLWFPGGQSKG